MKSIKITTEVEYHGFSPLEEECQGTVRKVLEAHADIAPMQFKDQHKILVPIRHLDHASDLERLLGTRTQAFNHIGYASVLTSAREEQRMIRAIQKEKPHILGQGNIIPKHLVYNPELILSHILPRSRQREMWNLTNIGARQAQMITKGEGMTVAVIDTGVDYDHDELQHAFNPRDRGYNFVDDNEEVMDKDMHGTHVAGTIAGKRTGVAPGARIKAFVVLNEQGYGNLADVMHALDWSIQMKIDVVNMSLGSNQYVEPFDRLCRAAYKEGVLIAAAAGNESSTMYSYPAAYQGVLGVAAVDKWNQWQDFSNRNDKNDLCAPGRDIYSCVPGGYDYFTGTSMATPHVAGSLALLKSQASYLDASDISRIITAPDCVKHLGSRDKFGAGLVRPDYCLQRVNKLEEIAV